MASRSEILALKRQRRLQFEYVDGDYETRWVSIPSGPHAPNKNESHAMRRLMSQTGLTEQQLRAHKAYRRILADASRAVGAKTAAQRYALRVRKAVLRELQLPKEHPTVREAFIARLAQRPSLRRFPLLSSQELWALISSL